MDLNGCVNDIRDVVKEFKKRGFVTATLLDSKATNIEICKALLGAITSLAPDDVLVIHYSGHGTYVPDKNGDEVSGNDSCWCPHDIMTAGPITDDTIYSILRKKPTGSRIVVFSDSCFSGTVLRAFGDPGAGKPRFMPPSVFLKNNKSFSVTDLVGGIQLRDFQDNVIDDATISKDVGGTLLLMSGCQDNQTSADAYFSGRYNGAFTYFMLKALREMPEGASYKQWFKKIREYLPSYEYSQAPNLYGKGMMSKIFT